MSTYRVQHSSAVATVKTASEYVTMKQDADGKFRCIGTGSKLECFEVVERCEPNKAWNSYAPTDGGHEITY